MLSEFVAEDGRICYRDLVTAEKGEALILIAVDWVAEKVRRTIQQS